MMSRTKARILDTALILFPQNGYYGTSMKDIAGMLGLSKAALYKHFESKEEIPKTPGSTDKLISLTMHMANFTIHD